MEYIYDKKFEEALGQLYPDLSYENKKLQSLRKKWAVIQHILNENDKIYKMDAGFRFAVDLFMMHILQGDFEDEDTI